MKNLLKYTVVCLLLLPLQFANAQSTNGNSTPSGRDNWFPNRGNVGISTRTPREALEVVGNVLVSQTIFTNGLETLGLKATSLNVSQDASIGRNLFIGGNVGINVTNPVERMEIGGNLKVSQGIFGDQLTVRQFTATDGIVNNSLRVGQTFIVDGLTGLGVVSPTERLELSGNLKATGGIYSDLISTGEGSFSRNVAITQDLIVSGKIGLGVSSPSEKFEVAGSAKISDGLFSNSVTSGDGLFSRNLRSNANIIADGSIGIGTATPSEKIDIIGNAKISEGLFSNSVISGDGLFSRNLRSNANIIADGSIGIGTATPSEKLEILGNAKISQGLYSTTINTADGFFTGNIKSNQNVIVDGSVGVGIAAPTDKLHVVGNIRSSADVLAVNVKADNGNFSKVESETLSITGNVGIGVLEPDEKLVVQGNIKATQGLFSDLLNTGEGSFSRNVNIGQNLLVSGKTGLGVASPNEMLEVSGNIKTMADLLAVNVRADKGYFKSLESDGNLNILGNVGIGVPASGDRLTVQGNIRASQGLFSDLLNTGEGSFSRNVQITQNLLVSGKTGLGVASPTELLEVGGNIKSNGDVLALNVRADKGYFSSLENNGNLSINGSLGVGVATPGEKVDIAGNIKISQSVLANSAQITQDISAGRNLSVLGAIGIGIAPGTEKLSVAGNAYVNGLLTAENLTVKQKLDLKGTFSVAGTLGVGIATPEATLHVNGDGKFDGDLRANKIIVNAIEIAGATQTPDGGSSVSLGDNLFVNGSVGIGTTKTNGYRLSVDGKIRAGDDIKVYSSTEWSDFVFEKNYKLMTLEEVEQYIKKHGHLAHIPSAEDVKKNGIDLAAMDAKLLQKIEEAFLHLIELKKENEKLKKEINSLKSSQKK